LSAIFIAIPCPESEVCDSDMDLTNELTKAGSQSIIEAVPKFRNIYKFDIIQSYAACTILEPKIIKNLII
jgi:hypothetical protein